MRNTVTTNDLPLQHSATESLELTIRLSADTAERLQNYADKVNRFLPVGAEADQDERTWTLAEIAQLILADELGGKRYGRTA